MSGLESPMLCDEEMEVEAASVVLLEAAPDATAGGEGGQLVFDAKLGKLVPAKPKALFYELPDDGGRGGKPRDESEEEELISGKESDVVRQKGETEYLTCGRALARDLMGSEAAACVYRCHCKGGVLIALDFMCALLGQTTRPVTAAQKRAAAAASLASAYGSASGGLPAASAGSAGAAGTAGVVGLGGVTDAFDASRRRGSSATPSRLGNWPMLLPYAVGLAPAATAKADPYVLSWRRLAGTAKEVADCAQGFAACGLPPGCAVAALTEKGCKLRSALGSAAPRQFAAAAMRNRREDLATERRRRRVEAECEKRLAEMSRAYLQIQELFPPLVRPNGPFSDFHGTLRGHCSQCNGCPGYELPKCSHEPNLMLMCAHCGCDAKDHEAMRTASERTEEINDDVLKSFKFDS